MASSSISVSRVRAATTIQTAVRAHQARKAYGASKLQSGEDYETFRRLVGDGLLDRLLLEPSDGEYGSFKCSICLNGLPQLNADGEIGKKLPKLNPLLATSCMVNRVDGLKKAHPHVFHIECAQALHDVANDTSTNCPGCHYPGEITSVFAPLEDGFVNSLTIEGWGRAIRERAFDPTQALRCGAYPLSKALGMGKRACVIAILDSEVLSPAEVNAQVSAHKVVLSYDQELLRKLHRSGLSLTQFDYDGLRPFNLIVKKREDAAVSMAKLLMELEAVSS